MSRNLEGDPMHPHIFPASLPACFALWGGRGALRRVGFADSGMLYIDEDARSVVLTLADAVLLSTPTTAKAWFLDRVVSPRRRAVERDTEATRFRLAELESEAAGLQLSDAHLDAMAAAYEQALRGEG